MQIFSKQNFNAICSELAAKEPLLQKVLTTYGYPPCWTRPNSFETIVLTILEQQVSLASAFAAYKKLKDRLGKITPPALLALTEDELRQCYFSRQKIVYVRGLADAILTKKISLPKLKREQDDQVREKLKSLKGIGDWTVDIYLIHALQRADIFPVGDLALVNGMRMLYNQQLTKDEIISIAASWQPYRSIATMIIWHYYIKRRNIKLLH